MHDNFKAAIDHVLQYEGGYSNHPLDPGGATNLGITQAVLTAYRGYRVTKAQVKALSVDEAAEIFRLRYWDRCSCDEIPDGLDIAVFDCAVNQGVTRASKLIQLAVHVRADGIIGPITLGAIQNSNHKDTLIEFMARRMRAYGGLTTLFKTFGLGWSRRLTATLALALLYTRV
jgi:lysozyme family protein